MSKPTQIQNIPGRTEVSETVYKLVPVSKPSESKPVETPKAKRRVIIGFPQTILTRNEPCQR